MVCVLATAPVIARALGPEGRGLTAAALAILALAPLVVALGVPLAIRRRLAVDVTARADLVRTGRVLAASTALVSTAAAVPLEALALPGLDGPARTAFFVSMALVPLSVSWAIDANVLLVERRFRLLGALSLVHGVVSTVMVVGFWAWGRLDVSTVLYAFLAGNVVTFLVGLVVVDDRGGKVSGVRDVVREGCSLVAGQLAEVGAARVAQIAALPLVGPAPAGLYSVAATAGGVGAPVADAYANASFGRLADRPDPGVLVAAVRRGAALALLSGAGVACAAWVLVPVAFGDQFTASRPLALLVAATTTTAGIGAVGGAALAAQRSGHRMSMARAVGLALSCALLVPAAEWLGVTGVALAMLVGSLLTTTLILRLVGISAAQALPRPRDAVASVHELFGAQR